MHEDQAEEQEWLSETNETLCVLLIYIYTQNSTFKRNEPLPILLLSNSVFYVTGRIKYELKHSKLISQHITALLRFWTSPYIHTLIHSTPWLIKKFSYLKSIHWHAPQGSMENTDTFIMSTPSQKSVDSTSRKCYYVIF